MKSARTLACELRRSRVELLAILLLTAAALAAPWAAPLAEGARAVLSLAALAAGGYAAWERSRRRWTALALSGDGAVALRAGAQAEWRGTLQQATVLGPILVLAVRAEDGASFRLPLYPDSADRDMLRRLRVLLRHGWRPEPGGAIR